MNGKPTVRFHEATKLAVENIRAAWQDLDSRVVFVRDLRGRLRVVLPGAERDDERMRRFAEELSRQLGSYGFPPGATVLFGDRLLEGDALFAADNPDRRLIHEEGERRLWLLDRQLIGADWNRAALPRQTATRRVTFYGVKGGVGRSTALSIWSWWLAKAGKNVLILDLDLESPGVSSTLLPAEHLPDFGIVDWLIEDGVEQAESVEAHMVATSPLTRDLPGTIRVVPAYGRQTGDYLPKLFRCYLDPAGAEASRWGERLQQMVERIENSEMPDVVILDSRAGLHDIAALLIHRMDADIFLFAVDSAQTWKAYSFLFQFWRGAPQLTEFRRRLQIVASMVPETGREEYLGRFVERSWDLFRENLYDEAEPGDPDAFTFDLRNEDAPHFPLPIFWNRALQEFEPSTPGGFDEQIARGALGIFLDEADRMVFPLEEAP